MLLGDTGEKKGDKGLDSPGHGRDQTGFGSDFHQAHPETHDADHGDAQLYGFSGRVQRAVCHRLHVPCKRPVDDADGDHGGPDIVQHEKPLFSSSYAS